MAGGKLTGAAIIVAVATSGCVRWDDRLNIVSAEFVDIRETSFFDDPTEPFEGDELVGLRFHIPLDIEEYGTPRGVETVISIELCDREDVRVYGPRQRNLGQASQGGFIYEDAVKLFVNHISADRNYDLRLEISDLCVHAQTIAMFPDLFWGKIYRLPIPGDIERLADRVNEFGRELSTERKRPTQ